MSKLPTRFTPSTQVQGDFRVDSIEAPAPGSSVGGDVLLLETDMHGVLRFLIADMSGSGAMGHEAWLSIESSVRRAWERMLEAHGSMSDLRRFGEEVNRCALEARVSLCLAAGTMSSARMTWATWGYGVHVLPSSDGVARTLPDLAEAHGMKLGWMGSGEFAKTKGSFVGNSFKSPSRAFLFTDGILGNDHADPEETWKWMHATATAGASVEETRDLEWLIDRSDIQADDVTVAVVNRNS